MPKTYEMYEHHGGNVMVRSDLKGEHRSYCMCYDCLQFDPEDRETNCPIANAIFKTCQEFNVVTPVWECPEFEPA